MCNKSFDRFLFANIFFSIFFFHLKRFAIINGATNDTVEHNEINGILLYFSNFMFARNWGEKKKKKWERNCEHDWTSFEQSISIQFFLNECDNQTSQATVTISKSMKCFLLEIKLIRAWITFTWPSWWLNGWYFDIIIILCWIKISLSLSISCIFFIFVRNRTTIEFKSFHSWWDIMLWRHHSIQKKKK